MPIVRIQGDDERRLNVHYEVDTDLPSLGEGGMGKVMQGVRVDERSGIRHNVAIKFLFDDLPENAIERARREAAIQIHNENLVEMYGFIAIEQKRPNQPPVTHYHVVSELLEGVMLFDLLKGKVTDRNGKEIAFARELYAKYQNNKLEFAIFIVKNILSGIMALHDKGYIHRDLDPSNIMITADRKVKIIDFGIAKKLDSLNTQDQQLTNTGQFVGKAAYGAPELVLGDVHSQDKTTDLYAVGIMLYQFVTGSLPFEGTIADVIKKQVNEKIPVKLVPYKVLRPIIAKATAKKQSDRYASAAEMRVDLEHINIAVESAKPITTHDGKAPAVGASAPKSKLLIAAIAIGVVVIAAVAGILLTLKSGPSAEELEAARIDSLRTVRQNMVIDDARTALVTDDETGASMRPVAYLTDEAVKLIEKGDSASVVKGIAQLRDISDNYATMKNAARAMAITAGLMKPLDSQIDSELMKKLRKLTAGKIERNAAKSHELLVKAYTLNPDCYQAAYELCSDYLFAAQRIGDASKRDIAKCRAIGAQGVRAAAAAGDKEYEQILNTRVKQADGEASSK